MALLRRLSPASYRALSLTTMFTACLALAPAPRAQTLPADDLIQKWTDDAQATMANRAQIKPNKRRAKNVILFIADGMDPTTITAARIYDGQSRGEDGEENFLSFETLPHLAMVKTYTTNAQTPDSAGTATAMVAGVKTKSGVISMTDAVVTDDCAASKGSEIVTVAELAEQAGLATGIISTARLTHATPATMYAHAANRNWEADSLLSEENAAAGCVDIARQLIEFSHGDGIDVAMGGGRRNFLPRKMTDPEKASQKGRRKDGRNLVQEWTDQSADHAYIYDRAGFEGLDRRGNLKLLGLFEPSHMQYELDRSTAENQSGNEPSLAEMTDAAIDILAQNKKGYVLMVEGGRVDHAHHAGNAARALKDTQAFADAVALALRKTDVRDTLIIVTADHGHTVTLQGYPVKGNNILGLVRSPYDQFNDENGLSLALDGKPYPTLAYGNGPGAHVHEDNHGFSPRPLLTDSQTTDPDFKQPAAIPLRSETHGGQDVTIYARGPQAWLFSGVVEQTYIFHVMEKALDLKRRAARANRKKK